MTFITVWHTLLEELEEMPDNATVVTPLSNDRFRISDIQEHRVLVHPEDGSGTKPLQRDQFEELYERITDEEDEFELDRLPPTADPYPAVLSLHPRFEINEKEGVIHKVEMPTMEGEKEEEERREPNLDVYADALLLVDALEVHEATKPERMDTEDLVNLYTLLSDVQRNANNLRQTVTEVLLDRLHHDRPVSGSYGSVQRTTRRNRNLKDEEEVLSAIEEAGVPPEHVTGVDPDKVDDAIDVTELSESDVYEIDESEYVRKAEVKKDVKESRLSGLKDKLNKEGEDDEAEELRQEIEELEERIDELTNFKTGSEIQE